MKATEVRTVLAVDDDERILASLRRMFGHRRMVHTATSSQQALALARREQPQLAVVDMQLGFESGIDLVRALRAEFRDMAIALISGYLYIDATVAAVRAGADVILPKPCNANDILRRLDEGLPETIDLSLERTPTLARAEAEHIERVMFDCKGNVSEAARRLGLYRSSLQRRLRKLGH